MPFDPFLLLTPILLLAILSLVGFTGCQLFLDFEQAKPPTPPTPPNQAPQVQISSVSVDGAAFACKTFGFKVIGSDFVAGSSVTWNGASIPTSFVSATQLQAEVTVNDVTQTSAQITVIPPSGTPTAPFPFSFTVGRGVPKSVTFESLRQSAGNNTGPVPSTFGGIDFGSGWDWFDHNTELDAFDIQFRSGQEASFGFTGGVQRILESIVVLNYSNSQRTVTLSDGVQTKSVAIVGTTTTFVTNTITTGWTKCSSSVRVQCQGNEPLFVRVVTYLDPI